MITAAEDAIAERKRGRRLFGGPRVPVLDPGARKAAALALKSGNFGKDDFFTRAWTLIA